MLVTTLEYPFVDDDRTAKEHPTLAHYTSISALSGILSSGGLWATHYQTLNDHSEFKLASEAVALQILHDCRQEISRMVNMRPVLSNRVKTFPGGLEALLRQDSETVPKVIRKLADKYLPMHVASFTSHRSDHQQAGGNLSLWRGYGHANGIALLFNTNLLMSSLSEIREREKYASLFIAPATYGANDRTFREQVATMAPVLADNYVALTSGTVRGTKLETLTDEHRHAHSQFMISSILHKHPGFEDEREVRLVASPLMFSDDGTPYSEPLWIDQTAGKSRVLLQILSALTAVMIGPSERQEAHSQTVKELLREAGVSAVVTLSDIPYREITQ